MKNTLGDLNNHLFAEIERLGDEDLKNDELKEEIERARAISNVSTKIIENANLVLQAEKFKDERLSVDPLPEILKRLE